MSNSHYIGNKKIVGQRHANLNKSTVNVTLGTKITTTKRNKVSSSWLAFIISTSRQTISRRYSTNQHSFFLIFKHYRPR